MSRLLRLCLETQVKSVMTALVQKERQEDEVRLKQPGGS